MTNRRQRAEHTPPETAQVGFKRGEFGCVTLAAVADKKGTEGGSELVGLVLVLGYTGVGCRCSDNGGGVGGDVRAVDVESWSFVGGCRVIRTYRDVA